MATQPGEGAILEEKPHLPSSIEEATVDPNPIASENAAITKSPAVKPTSTAVDSEVNQTAVGANGTLSPTLNGHSNAQPISNGIGTDAPESVPASKPSDPQELERLAEKRPSEEPKAAASTATSGVESETAALKLGSDSMDDKEDKKMEDLSTAPEEPSGVDNTAAEPPVESSEPLISSTSVEDKPSEQKQDEEMTSPTNIAAPEKDSPQISAQDQPSQQKQDEETTPATNMPVPEKSSPELPPAEETSQVEAPKEMPPVSSKIESTEPKPVTPTPNLAREDGTQDQEMPDAPLSSPAKVSRGREEDASEEPAAKRPKTDDVIEESQFKVPEVPAEPTTTDSGLPSTSKPISKMQTRFFIRCLQGLKRTNDSRFFKVAVDPVKLNIPNYPIIIKHPMDMLTMENKLKAGEYSTADQVIAEFKLMVDNSATFNGPDHVVTLEGRRLQQSFERHLSKLPGADEPEPAPTEKKAKKIPSVPTKSQPLRRDPRPAGGNVRAANATSPTFALGPEGLPLIRRDSTTVDGRPKRSIHPPKNRDLPYSTKPKKKKFQWELKFCQEVLDELHKPKHYSFVSPFYLPVDPVALNIPTYHNIIKKPMDLQTIQTKLQAGQYENAKEMEIDVRQIFKNCYKFNIPGDPTYNAGKRAEEIFDHKWSQKSRWLEAHEPSPGHQSVGTSDDSDDNDEESDDGEAEKLSILQKQIAEMSKQVDAITQKNKKTPPASSKKSNRSRSGKKDAKKGSGGSSRKDRKGGTKSGKPEKQRWVTYREKQIISNGISSLPDKRMSEALRIIQQNVPSLKGSNETEIELDIDELPNDVLLMLLKFVKKHSPQSLDIDEPAPEPAPSSPPSKPKKSKPMNKFQQEEQIRSLQGRLTKFQGGDHSSDPAPDAAESSGDDEDSEESEEE